LARASSTAWGFSRRIEQITRGTFQVKPGSLFPALHRMEEAGWLTSFWGESENNRLALGASRGVLLRLAMGQAALLILVGSTLGIGTALLASRLLANVLVGVTAHDPFSFVGAWALMTGVALLASSMPAADAARTDLVSVLRSE
jgi:hypothetical protein